MPGALDRHGQGTLLAGIAVGLAPVGDLAALVEAAAQALDVLVVDDFAGAEDRLLTAPSPAAEATAPATTAIATLRAVAAARAVASVATWATTGAIPTTGPVAAAEAVSTAIATAVTAGGTLGTGAEPGAGTLLAGRAGLLACLR